MNPRTSILLAAALLGCGNAEPNRVVVSDSAGIRIVVNPDIELPAWTIDSVPVLDIGALEGPPGHDLALPWSSIRLGDGRIAISNGQSNELRIFSADGTLLRAVGREGQGPGEFAVIAALRRVRGDTIVVADAALPRLTVFTSEGELARTIALEPIENRAPRLRGVMSDTLGVWAVTLFERSGGVSRGVRDELIVALRPLDGGSTVELGRFPAAEKFNQVMPNGSVAASDQPFSRNTFTAVGPDMVWVGQSDHYELRGYSANGELMTIARLDRPVTPVGTAERDRFFRYQLDAATSDDRRRTLSDIHRTIEHPSTMPAFSALIADIDGNIWVKEYRPPWETGPARWRIFAPDGTARAHALLPDGLTIHEIGRDHLLGMMRGEWDVEHVRHFRLHTSPE